MGAPHISYGLHRIDHAVGNVPRLVEVLEHIVGYTGTRVAGWSDVIDCHCLDRTLGIYGAANTKQIQGKLVGAYLGMSDEWQARLGAAGAA